MFLFLSACGGDSKDAVNPINSLKAVPNVTVSFDTDKSFVRINETLTVSWASTNAETCKASGSWQGSKPVTGSERINIKNHGSNEFIIECTNTNSSIKKSATVTTPIPVLPTSYENKNSLLFDNTQIPSARRLGIKLDDSAIDSNERSVTFADFFQEGRVSAFVVVSAYKNIHGIPGIPDSPGKVYFLDYKDGKWIDRTTDLIKDEYERYTCVSSSYSIVADFNNDLIPDVFVSCTGYDYDLGINDIEKYKEIYLEYQYLYISQPDKTFKRIKLPYKLYGHKASAADINKDGFVDILITNQTNLFDITDREPFVLKGNGDGTFIKTKQFTQPLFNLQSHEKLMDNTYQVELVPIDGRLDVFFAGSLSTVHFKGLQDGGFDKHSGTVIQMPISKSTNRPYDMPLDLIYKDNYIYFNTTTHTNEKVEWAIIKYELNKRNSDIIHIWINKFADLLPYSAQIKINSKDNIVAYTAGCSHLTKQGMCGMSVELK